MQKKTIFYFLLFFFLPTVVVAEGIVKVIYFVPRDRTFQWTIPQTLDTQIKKVQSLYADQMEAHGFGRKTFGIETDDDDTLIVHPVFGLHDDTHYHEDSLNKTIDEISGRFNIETDVYLIVLDVSTELVDGYCGIGRYDGGPAIVPASGDCMKDDNGVVLIAHELGHTFNLVHDFRNDSHIMSYGHNRTEFSDCAAALLNVSPFFNDSRNNTNTSASIELLTPWTYPANAETVSLQFKVSDSDGIYQVQFEHAPAEDIASLTDCKKFDNTETETVEFTLPPDASSVETNRVWIRVVDQNGYITTKEWTLEASEEIKTTETTEAITYLTISHNSPDSLIPTNARGQWAGWRGWIWEKTPDGNITEKPTYFITHPYVNTWEHWFYAHAESRLVYDISDKDYTRFECLFYLANPCASVPPPASMEVICSADGTEIYNSGVLSGVAEKQQNRHQISFDIPAGTKTLTINITDGPNDDRCDHFVVGNPRLFYIGTETETITETIDTDRIETYLTIDYNSPDALVPTNPRSEWSDWASGIWEKTPDGVLPDRPHQGFINSNTLQQFYDEWDHFFYSHADSRFIYDLSGGNYARFEAQFDMPNPCGNVASVELICLADGNQIYNSGILRDTRNVAIAFDIPKRTQTLTITVTDAWDGNGCDHFVIANARLIHRKPKTIDNYTDVNDDGVVNIIDLVLVAVRYGETIEGDTFPNPDVNRNGIVDLNDIILVTDDMTPVASAPTLLTKMDWQQAYTNLPDAVVDKGIAVLEQLFNVVPAKTALLANYPNPFNPETWIPYKLETPAEVCITIYATDGTVVRKIDLGHQVAGIYQNRNRAAYWDGRNTQGEPVASGVYVYTLKASDFTASRKMFILK